MFGLSNPKVPQIEASAVMEAIKKKPTVRILDVRTQHEYLRGNIKGSINIPVDLIAQDVVKTIADKKETIYVYCLSGSRSVLAVDLMMKMGYKNVFNMTSGLLSWRALGYPLTVPLNEQK